LWVSILEGWVRGDFSDSLEEEHKHQMWALPMNQRCYMRVLLTELSYRTDEYLAAHRRFVERFAEEYGGSTGAPE